MDKVARKKQARYTAKVAANLQIGTTFYRLTLELDNEGSKAYANLMPGQFAQFDLSMAPLPPDENIPPNLSDSSKRHILLRRPFSFSNMTISDKGIVTIDVLFCVLGPCTLRMTALKQGDSIYVSQPLGNGFSVPQSINTALLVAGGMGAPPIQHLAAHLKHNFPQIEPIVFIGAKTFDEMPYYNLTKDSPQTMVEEFARHGIEHVHIATDDGSAGHRGFVTDLLTRWYNSNPVKMDSTVIYACGPEPMLEALAKTSKNIGIPCQLSMERVMACGIGLCQSCAIKTTNENTTQGFEYKLCCKNGPVFNADEIYFDNDC